jgi:tRNA1Val (adenine37-N6)-methyltransferase
VSATSAPLEWSEDAVLGGRVVVAQPRRGYRFTADALWLVLFCRELARGHVVDLGAGCGVVGLCLATRADVTGVELVERQASLAACARRSVELSAPPCPVRVHPSDLRELTPGALGGPARLVLCNPPFFDLARSRAAASSEVDQARRAWHGDVAAFAQAGRRLGADGGWFAAVFPAAQRAQLLAALASAGLVVRLEQAVHPRPGAAARLVLVAAQAGVPGAVPRRAPWFEQEPDGGESALARSLRDPQLLAF